MADLVQWWNLVYVLAFGIAALYAVLNAFGLATGEAGADVDVDADADLDLDADAGDLGLDADVDAGDVDVGEVDVGVDVDHDVEIGVEADVDAEVDADVEADVDAHVDVDHDVEVAASHEGPSFFEEALSFFGIGRVPLSVILMTFLTTFAVVGWAVNTVLKPVVLSEFVFFPVSFASAVFVGLLGTKLLASVLGQYLRPVDSAAVRRSNLVGRLGTASLPVNEAFGTALVRDAYGTQHKVVCKVAPGAEPVPKGQTVLLVRFVREQQPGKRAGGYYLVEPYEIPGTDRRREERRD